MMFDAKKVKNEIVKWIQDFFYENGKDCNAVIIWQFPSKGMSRTRTATWRLAILPERIRFSARWGICMSRH